MLKPAVALVVASLLLCGCPDSKTGGADKSQPPTADGKNPVPTEPDKNVTVTENFWKDVGVGTAAESRTSSEVAGQKMETTIRFVLKTKTDAGYVLTAQSNTGGNMSSMDMPLTPWTAAITKVDPNAPKATDLGDEELKVAGDAYKCKHTKVEAAGNTTESWTYKGTLVVKSVTKGSVNSTTELTKLEKK